MWIWTCYFDFEVVLVNDCLNYKQHYELIKLGGLGDRKRSSSFYFYNFW